MAQTSEDIRLLNEKSNHASGFVTRINNELGKVIIGQQTDRTVAHWPVKQWACITRRSTRAGENTCDQIIGAGRTCRFQPHPVHPGPVAG